MNPFKIQSLNPLIHKDRDEKFSKVHSNIENWWVLIFNKIKVRNAENEEMLKIQKLQNPTVSSLGHSERIWKK